MHLRKTSAHAQRRRRGFTLMELLVVVAILLVLAATAIFAFRSTLGESKIGIARTQCATLKQALERYSMMPSSGMTYPDPGMGWDPLLAAGVINKAPLDPWNQPYRWGIVPAPDGISQMAAVWSSGPNMIDENGQGDDVNSEQ